MLTRARRATPSDEKKSIVSLNDSMIPWNWYEPHWNIRTGGAFAGELVLPPLLSAGAEALLAAAAAFPDACMNNATWLVKVRTSTPVSVVSNCRSMLSFPEN
jgi:hypothetical protein